MHINVIKPKGPEKGKLRTCAYCRVSTDHEDQENSLENQISHYEEVIRSNPEYEFVKVYYDFGISGFKEKRPGFQEMIADAKAGKIDLIITKSITRLARNTVTILKAIRELKEIGVGIFFELQNINTLTESGELLLTVYSAFAQGESEAASVGAKMVYQRKYEAGIPVQYLDRSFGYTQDENGKYIPDPDEAPWVVKMFELAAAGYNLAEITRFLNKEGVKTVRGARFTESTVQRILENEIYKGDYIMHKTYVNADRKQVKNRGQVDAWYVENDHIPLVSRKLWDKAQAERQKKKAYLEEGSFVDELNDENYPYRKQLYCAICGSPLYRRVYSHGNRLNWGCSGTKQYKKEFCEGINIPDSVVRSWGDIEGNIYIRKEADELGKVKFKYVKESTWRKNHSRKKHKSNLPPLTEKTYPYLNKIFCGCCGGKLVRNSAHGRVTWLCNKHKRKGSGACEGVRIPDEVIKEAWPFDQAYWKGNGDKHGKKSYSYSSEYEKG